MTHDLEMKREKGAPCLKKKERKQFRARRGSRPKRGQKQEKRASGSKKK